MSSVHTATTVRDALSGRFGKTDASDAAPGATVNPPFIADDDTLGESHRRSTREVARFSSAATNLLKTSEPVTPDHAEVKVPQLVLTTDGWDARVHTITGSVSLKVSRASKFSGKPDLSEPSRQLAEFTRGEGRAWASMRDEDVPALLVAWARSVVPTAFDARNASHALALAMAARAGIAVNSTNQLGW